MLKNIPNLLSPELLKVLAEMGHGDRICIGDGNFPGNAIARRGNCIPLSMSGLGVNELLDAILTVLPLDRYVDHPVLLMQKTDSDKDLEIPIWKEFEKTVTKHDERGAQVIGFCERQQYYREAEKCYCIIISGETSLYANVILQKGVV